MSPASLGLNGAGRLTSTRRTVRAGTSSILLAMPLTHPRTLQYVTPEVINRRYFLVILDPSGRSVRRVGISLRALEIAAAAAVVGVVVGLAMLVHGLARAHVAVETLELERDNETLREIAQQVAQRLPAARMLDLRSELTFAQLWSKSGLGVEPNVLGVGPIEEDPLIANAGTAGPAFGMRFTTSHVLSVTPAALPLELDRLETDGLALQTSLGEMLEYFHDATQLLSNTPSIKPVLHGHLTSPFGKRSDPYTQAWVMHKGLDIGGQIGSEVLAPADGVVIFTGVRGGYGNTIVIDHGFGLQTHYAHLSRIRVRIGDHVQRGDVIAEVGSTGRSTGPHLHYEVRRNGQPLNPIRFILD
jgi:murein DD-endopeptidase MepM/ murein hydrolase activator NlpD